MKPNPVHYNIGEIIGTYGCSTANYQEAVALLNKRDINVNLLVDAKYHLKAIQKAFEDAVIPGKYRISITIS